ncbi:excalibur calcium-binding domain-containing protein [Mesorhizobium sp. Z1-4]|uniref:excalibur calcium-binding domain-containing protein n=1 Tax=Mesorhizobium sp. Z1-4 TaxID=2448478 RepID=UPI000FDCCD69|nr:excalibur calcium-binding domain-containing protein [Mesorhizobium sp. Z1-4]
MKHALILAICVAVLAASGGLRAQPLDMSAQLTEPVRLAQARKTCKQVSSCEEAVILWCSGYDRADGDDDGIPCENVCPSKRLVDQIRRQIGC